MQNHFVNIPFNKISAKHNIHHNFNYEIYERMYSSLNENDIPIVYTFIYKYILSLSSNLRPIIFSPDYSVSSATCSAMAEKYMEQVDTVIASNLNKNYKRTHVSIQAHSRHVVYNTGVVFHSHHHINSRHNCKGIMCNTYLEYLGFNDTKKFRKMLLNIEKELEEVCHVYTGKHLDLES